MDRDEKIFAGVVVVGMSLIVLMIVLMVNETNEAIRQCAEDHEGKNYSTEQTYPGDDSCQVKKVNLFDGNCQFIKTVYVSTCPGKTSWTEQHREGKHTVTEEHETSTQ